MSTPCRGQWLALVVLTLLLHPVSVAAENVTLAWDPSAGATGYTVRWGTALGSYPNSADAGDNTSLEISGLAPGGTYYAVVQAYDDFGISDYSTALQFTVAVPCSYSINPASVTISPASAQGTIYVTTQPGCGWEATSASGIISFQGGTGRSGSGPVVFNVDANLGTTIRTATATVAGLTFTLSQAGTPADAPGDAQANWSNDFDGDGKNDLLVHDLVGGTVDAWLLDGTTVKGQHSLSHRINDPDWMLVGRGDFNGDDKPDLIWQHRTEGWVYVWFMDGTNRTGGTYLSMNRVADVRWRVMGVGDFNRDGNPDLLWQHATEGALAVWLTNGSTVTAALSLTPDRTLDPLWQVAGVADFNGDGKSDLLWRHRGHGDVGVWLMNGLTRITFVPLTPSAVADQQWQIAAVMDADGDNDPDLIWEHPAGWIAVWFMDGTTRVSNPSIGATVPKGWKIVGPK